MSDRLKDKVCIVTGGARGIGATTARIFAREGAAIVLADVRDELGEQVVTEIRAAGGRAQYVHTDVAKLADAKNLADTAVATFSTIHVLFNNAGQLSEGRWMCSPK